MSYSNDELKSFNDAAIKNSQIYSSVKGKAQKNRKGGKLKKFGAAGFLTGLIIFFTGMFGFANMIPVGVSERIIEETDIQYADAVQSKELVFQQAMYQGEIPEDTAKLLEENGVEVGYIVKGAFINGSRNLGEFAYNGDFIQGNQAAGELVLKMDGKIITAEEFIDEVNENVKLYDAFTKATYGRAAYYYDEAARKVFQKIGTNRNNYTAESDFDEVMGNKVGEGSDINVNSVSLVEKTRENENGETEVYYEYEENGPPASSKSSAGEFIGGVLDKNPAKNTTDSALYTANALTIADTVSKEERSSLFFVTFMENISKMKAGDGNESKINEAMNYLYDSAETEVVDVKTGEIIRVSGTALESPSLYAILAGEKINADSVENYSSERILKTVKNQLGVSDSDGVLLETVASSKKMQGSIGRFVEIGSEKAALSLIEPVEPTVSSSLMNNSYETIKGIDAGEFLVEGAVNVGVALAKQSGATSGDAAAVIQTARLNNKIVALEAARDRLNRSPFDITSKNTFLGSVIYNLAIITRRTNTNSVMAGFKTMVKTARQAAMILMPKTYADEVSTYLTAFGDCERFAMIGAVGTVGCSENGTFDTSTAKDPFNNADFIDFVNKNTTLNSSGERVINRGSDLEKFIIYNNERETPVGVMDGGILESLASGSSSIKFVSNILAMVKIFLGASEEDKRIALGATFVNSDKNPDWETYKYAQRYTSLARAINSLKQFSNSTAYNNILYFEGEENPVIALLREYYVGLK